MGNMDDTYDLLREAEILSLRFITARQALVHRNCQNCNVTKEAARIITLSSRRLVEISHILESRKILKRQEFEDMINVSCIMFLGRDKS